MAKRIFVARYDGSCADCGLDILAGVDECVFNDFDQVVHVDCYDGEVADA